MNRTLRNTRQAGSIEFTNSFSSNSERQAVDIEKIAILEMR